MPIETTVTNPSKMILMEPKIVRIKLTKEQEAKLERSKFPTGRYNVERSFRGLCSKCGKLATYRKITKIEDAQVIERYCEEHKGLG